MIVPRVDLGAPRAAANAEDRRQAEMDAARAIDAACRRVGFFYVTGHGVDETVLKGAFEAAKSVFALKPEIKDKYHIRHSFPNQRGYVPFFEENIDFGNARDLKEAYDFGRPLAADDPDLAVGTPFHAENVFPVELPGFRRAIEAYYEAMLRLSDELVRLTALALELPDDFFAGKMDKAVANLRLLRYPAQPDDAEPDIMGVGAHTDYGFMTLLAQDDAGGLEIQAMDGAWLPVQPVPGSFVVNIGELLARWTNDRYRATPHRVINKSASERYSLPFFLDTNYHARIECIPTCLAGGETPKYAPVIGGEYLTSRFDQTFNYRRNGTAE